MSETADTLHRFLLERADTRGELVQLDDSWQQLLNCADYPPIIRTLLGEAMAATALMAATIKFSGSITLQVRGGSPVTLLVMQSTADGAMRGLAKWQTLPVSTSLAELLGNGQMVITIDPGQGKEQYQGVVELAGDSLADAIANYFNRSEQLPTVLHLYSNKQRVSGLMLQKLPGAAEDVDGWDRAQQLAATITADEALLLDAETVLYRLFHQEQVRLLDTQDVRYQCACSRERTAAMIKSLGRTEVEDILKEQGTVEVTCEFCNTQYRFDAVDTEQLFSENAAGNWGKTVH